MIINMKYMKRASIPAWTTHGLTRSAPPRMAQGVSVKLAVGRENGVKKGLVSSRIGCKKTGRRKTCRHGKEAKTMDHLECSMDMESRKQEYYRERGAAKRAIFKATNVGRKKKEV